MLLCEQCPDSWDALSFIDMSDGITSVYPVAVIAGTLVLTTPSTLTLIRDGETPTSNTDGTLCRLYVVSLS